MHAVRSVVPLIYSSAQDRIHAWIMVRDGESIKKLFLSESDIVSKHYSIKNGSQTQVKVLKY